MRIYQRILLVVVLTIVLTAVGAGWVRYCLSPLADRAAAIPDRPVEIADDLPSACLDELAALENATGKTDAESQVAAPADSIERGRDKPHRSPPGLVANDLEDTLPRETNYGRPAGSRPERDRDLVGAPGRPPRGSNDAARPIAAAQSAEWNEPAAIAAAVAQPKASRTTTLPVTVEEPLPNEPLDSLKSADVLELMRQLRADAEAFRNAARRELLRRGFGEVDLELARQLFSPDAAARKQLAFAVPRLASIDAARWLMWLAADPQPEVRIAAITTLATTGDPKLLDRVEALARKDSDPQVQAIADQIAKQHDLSASRGSANPLR